MSDSTKPNTHAVFEYAYTDASGYHAYDMALLMGPFTAADVEAIRDKLESRQFFIPERVGLPALQNQLYVYSGGYATEDDHPWHEFIRLRNATTDEIESLPLRGELQALLSRFSGISDWEK